MPTIFVTSDPIELKDGWPSSITGGGQALALQRKVRHIISSDVKLTGCGKRGAPLCNGVYAVRALGAIFCGL